MVPNKISCSIMFILNHFVFCRYLDMEKRYKQEMDRRRGVTADFKVSKNCKMSGQCHDYKLRINIFKYCLKLDSLYHGFFLTYCFDKEQI